MQSGQQQQHTAATVVAGPALVANSPIVTVVNPKTALAWMYFATHDTPAGQPSLAVLDTASLATLKADFNAASSETRLIVLLSPT